METQKKIRIILADDHEIMCEGLKFLVDRQDDMEVVGLAGTGDQVVELAEKLNPDVIAMDISMPVMDGIEASTRLRGINSKAKILVLSAVLTRHTIDQAIASGVTGLMMKESAFKEFAEGVRAVRNGERYFCSRIMQVVASNYVGRLREGTTESPIFTERECEVIRQFANGKSTKEIALRISMSGKTIDACRRKIMDKLHINSTAELVKYALRSGLTTL
jgi:DNA-binding NarL/FixJ family response regulator